MAIITPDKSIRSLDELVDTGVQILLDSTSLDPYPRMGPDGQPNILTLVYEHVNPEDMNMGAIRRKINYINQFYTLLRDNPNIGTTRRVVKECQELRRQVRNRYGFLQNRKGKKGHSNGNLRTVSELKGCIERVVRLMSTRAGGFEIPSDTEELSEYLKQFHNQETDIDLVSCAVLNDKYTTVLSNDRHLSHLMGTLRKSFFKIAGAPIPAELKERISPYSASVFSLHPVELTDRRFDITTLYRDGI